MADQNSLRLIGFGLGLITMAVMLVAIFVTVKVDPAFGEQAPVAVRAQNR